MRYKMSHANAMFLYYGTIEEGRTAKITVLILLMIIFSWTPYYTISITNVMNFTSFPEALNKVAMLCAFSNTILSPLLYAYRSRRVQRDIKVSSCVDFA